MANYPDRRSAALPALAAAQRMHGWCSPEALEQVACVMRVTPAYLDSVATFYDMLETSPVGRHSVYVCTNISCSLRGADALYEAIRDAAEGDADVNVRSFECLGACDIAPMASVDGVYVGPLDRRRRAAAARGRARRTTGAAGEAARAAAGRRPARQQQRVPAARGRAGAQGQLSMAAADTAGGTPILLFADIDEPGLRTLEVYERRGGYQSLRKALAMTPEEVLEQLKASGIRGRGGAGFAMGTKISFLPKGSMDKYLVCNADESEPGTFKDRELMQKTPHMLIEGIVIAAHAAAISRAFIYIRGEYELQADMLDAALAEARAAGYVGEDILGSGHSLSLVVHRGAGAYICGEETGLLDSLEGKRGNPRLKPPFPAIQGLYQGPTLINNVETLSTVPAIIAMGGEEYAKLGVETSTGTKLVSVSGHVKRPGNYEIELGIPSREIIYGLAGGPPDGREVKCWFPGGSSSPVLKAEDLDVPYDFNSLAAAGTMLGSGAIIVVDDSTPILDVAMKVAKFYRHESCGKCTPCREGTNWTVKMLERIDSGEATPMDIEIMASVQEHIMGNCLCVLGDAMAMPISSMIAKFRDEFEAHIEAARARHGSAAPAPPRARWPPTEPSMPRPEPRIITFTIDGREVQAPENAMLVDAAKHGDVEIPVFCYEPKLGQPVGACRMCLVEIEGIPKLQTGCSTPVKDGMVVYTQSERVKTAQQSVVEFLLINHPLDCPVCDKGGECPLQDITFGWGGGISRFIEPKRHFVKPLELSPLIAIDRERCILCYRCVRFSQEVAEDYQLVLLERGAHSYVSTFDGHPYVAPFSGNIIELCPVGALTSRPYRFRARPWDIEGAGSVCTLCPAQCNVTITVRDERALRVLAARQRRGRRRLAVRQGPLRLPVLPRRRARHRAAACATAASCARSPGSARSRRPPPAWRAPARRPARSPAGRPPTRRACCSRV